MFPNLKERRNSPGTRLSGGEQQMLAVARILRTGAKLLLLDEISEGLAPVIVQALARMIRTLRAARLHHRDGRAELPLRRAAGRPLLRDGARPVIVESFRRRAGGEDGHAARVPGRLSPRFRRSFFAVHLRPERRR
jgi:hypothetical protein